MEQELCRVVDALPGLLWTAFPDGQIEFVNQRWCEYTGLGIDSSRGRGWQAAIHPEDLPRLLAGWRQDPGACAPVETEVRLRRADGKYRWFLFRAHPSVDASGRLVKWCGLGTDFDERKRTRETLREQQKIAQALLAGEKRLLEMIARGRPMADVLDALCRFVESTATGSYCSIMLLDPSGTKLQEAIAPSIAAEFNESARGWPLTRIGGPCVMAARDNIQVIMSDVASDTRWRNGWRALAQKHGLQSCWSTPVLSQAGKVLGTFALYWSEPGSPNPLQLELIERFTHIASIAVERAQRDAVLRQSEARLAEAERELQLTVDTLPILVASYRPDGWRTFVNQTWRDYTGLTLEGSERTTIVHPDDAARMAQEWQTSLAAGAPLNSEARLRRADGEYRWHAIRRVLARDDAGTIVKMYNVAVDIEERKRAEEALRRSEYDSRLIVDSIPGLIAIFAPDGEFEFVNGQVVEFFGKTLEDLKAKRWGPRDGIHPEDLPRGTELFKQSIASGDPFEFEVRCRRFDGVYRWFQSRGFPLRDSNGRIVRWYNLLIDIDERKRAEEALRQSEARASEAERELRLTLDTVPVIVWRGAANGYVQHLNKRWFEYTGTTPEQVRGRRWKQCVHPDDLERHVQTGTDYVAAGIPIDSEARLRRYDGEYRRFLFRPAALRDETGKITGWYGTIIDIEDRKRAEEKLVEAERELQRTIDNIPVLVGVYSADGRRLFANKRALEVTGLTAEDVPTERWNKAFHPDDVAAVESQWRACIASGELFEREVRTRMTDGSYRWHWTRRVPLRDEAGKIIRWYGISYDIEDQKRAEQELRRSQAYLAEAQRLSHTGSWAVDYANRKPIHSSEEHHRLFGFDPAAGMPPWRAWMDRIHPDDRARLRKLIERSSREKTDLEMDYRICLPDGTVRYVHDVGHPDVNAAGDVVEFVGTSVDVTQRRLAEEALAASERNLKLTVDTVPAQAWSARPDGSAEFFNQQYLDYVGLPAEQVLGWGWAAAVHPDDLSGLTATWQSLLASGTPGEAEARVRRHDGEYRWFLFRATPLRDDNGNIVKWYGFNNDIEDRKRTEEQLRRSEAFLTKAQRLSLTGSFSYYSATQEFTWSEELYRIFELQPGVRVSLELIGSRYHPEDRHAMEEVTEGIRRGAPDFDYEHRLVMPDGSIKHIRVVAQGVPDKEGRGLEYFGAVQDITQRRLAEAALDKARSELAHVTRVMSLGALTASIAHEVNQPLAGIITNASTCLRMLAADPPNVAGARETARRTIRDGNRAADVIARLRALFSKKAPATETVDLNEATREVLALVFSDLLRNRVFLRAEIDDDHPLLVTGDRVQLQQVILNLVRNASDAMNDVNDRSRHLLVRIEQEEDGAARLTVRDAGIGLEPQSIDRVFDAFYTTKSDGMGIGLSLSRSIIESHGGRLWAEANDGPGMTFSFSIPRPADGAMGDRAGDAVRMPKVADAREARGK